jgi:hypothetical protein
MRLPALSDVSTAISTWWKETARKIPKDKRRSFKGMAVYIMWNIWKHHNQLIFDSMSQTVQQVALKVKEDISQHKRAFNNLP